MAESNAEVHAIYALAEDMDYQVFDLDLLDPRVKTPGSWTDYVCMALVTEEIEFDPEERCYRLRCDLDSSAQAALCGPNVVWPKGAGNP